MNHPCDPARRRLLKTSLLAGGLAATGGCLSIDALAADKATVNMQLGWIAGGNQIGEVVGQAPGLLRRRKASILRSSRADPTSTAWPSSPPAATKSARCRRARRSCWPCRRACRSSASPSAPQRHPYTLLLAGEEPGAQARRHGRQEGRHPVDRHVLLRALLAKNKIAEKDVNIIPIGADMTPLMTGQVDVVHRLADQHHRAEGAGHGPRRPDAVGRGRAASMRCRTTPPPRRCRPSRKVLEALPARHRARLAAMPTPTATQAVDLLVKEYPNLNRDDERVALDVMLRYSFGDADPDPGLGRDGPGGLAGRRSRSTRELGQFTASTPKVDDVITLGHAQGDGQAARLKA